MIFVGKAGITFKYNNGRRNIEEHSESQVSTCAATAIVFLQTRFQPRANAVFKRLIWSETGLARRPGACRSLTTPP